MGLGCRALPCLGRILVVDLRFLGCWWVWYNRCFVGVRVVSWGLVICKGLCGCFGGGLGVDLWWVLTTVTVVVGLIFDLIL